MPEPLSKGTVIWWKDPDPGIGEDGDCSQYAIIDSYEGSGVYHCNTAKGGNLECLSDEIRVCTPEEANLVRVCSGLHSAMWDVIKGARESKDFAFEDNLSLLASAL